MEHSHSYSTDGPTHGQSIEITYQEVYSDGNERVN